MIIDANGDLEADWDEIERLTQCFDNGFKSVDQSIAMPIWFVFSS